MFACASVSKRVFVPGKPFISPPWIHSYFDNVTTKFVINNRTDAWRSEVNLLNILLSVKLIAILNILCSVSCKQEGDGLLWSNDFACFTQLGFTRNY